MANYLGFTNSFNSRINRFNRNYEAPVLIKNNQPKKRNLVINNKMCVLLKSIETYNFIKYILTEKGEFTRDAVLVYSGNKNILTVLQNQFKKGFRFFLSDHDDDDLIEINTFKRINEILIFNSISTQDRVVLSQNIIRSSTPDYNYLYFIIVSLLYTPKDALGILSLTSKYVDITKLRRPNTVTLFDKLVYIYIENNDFSIKILEYILSFNTLMGDLIEIHPIAIPFTRSNTVSTELSSLLSNNTVSNTNYTPTLFYVNSNNDTESNILLSILSSNTNFTDNYFLFNDTFLTAAFTKYFPYCFIVSRNFSQEGYRYANLYKDKYNIDLTPFNFSIYDFLFHLNPSLSNNTSNSSSVFKKFIDNNTIIANSSNQTDTMSYYNRKQTYIYTIDTNLIKRPISYRAKTNPLLTGEMNTITPSYDRTLYSTTNIITLFKCSDNGGMLIITKTGTNRYDCFASNNNGTTWYNLFNTTNPILDCAVYDTPYNNIIYYTFVIASNTDIYTILMVKNTVYTVQQISTMLTAYNIYTTIIEPFSTVTDTNGQGNDIFTLYNNKQITNIQLSNYLTGLNVCGIIMNNTVMIRLDLIIQYKVLRCIISTTSAASQQTFIESYMYILYRYDNFNSSYYYLPNIIYYDSSISIPFKMHLSKSYNHLSITKDSFMILNLKDNGKLSSYTTIGYETKWWLYKISTPSYVVSSIDIFEKDTKTMMYYCVGKNLYLTDYSDFSDFIITKILGLSTSTYYVPNLYDPEIPPSPVPYLTAIPTLATLPFLPNDKLVYTFPNPITELQTDSDGVHICIKSGTTFYHSNDSGKIFSTVYIGSLVNYTVTNSGKTYLCSNKILKTTTY